MAATSSSPFSGATIDVEQFNIAKFTDYRKLKNVVSNLKFGYVLRYTLIDYNFCHYLSTKAETDSQFRLHLINIIQQKLKDFEDRFPGSSDKLDAIFAFERQAFTQDPPTLLSTLLSDGPFVDFNDLETIATLEAHYGFPVTGKCDNLIANYAEKMTICKSKNFAINLFRNKMDEIFCSWQSDTNVEIESFTLFNNLVTQGARDIFLVFFEEALHRECKFAVEEAVERACQFRDLTLVKAIFENYYPHLDEGKKKWCHRVYHPTSKEIADYCSKIYEIDRNDIDDPAVLEQYLRDGDYEMFSQSLILEVSSLDDAILSASQGGSIENYIATRTLTLMKNEPINHAAVVEKCAENNCIDLARYLVECDPDREIYKKYFETRLQNTFIRGWGCKVINLSLMKSVLNL